MKFNYWIVCLLVLLISGSAQGQSIREFMNAQPDIKQIHEIPGNDFFHHTYEIMIREPLDHKDTTAGFFLQRVFVADRSVKAPVVFITEGYDANYAASPRYINELTPLLKANQICVEHRYFAKSVPDSLDWKYLTVENAAADHHHVVQIFKKYYSGKWINTGISKGGQTALAHRCFYPNDVDLTVAYVAPLNFGVEDGRHEPFLKQDGTKVCREKILALQREALKRRKEMIPLLEAYCKQKGYTFPIPMDQVLDFMVLEYSYAFWQWGMPCEGIPAVTASDQIIFDNLIKTSSPDYFSYEGRQKYVPFFYQAAHELGYYGYDTKPFEGLLTIKSAKGYLNRFMAPGKTPIPYDGRTSLMVKDFLAKKASNVILIYGSIDPWFATSATVRNGHGNLKMVKQGGCHKTRINNLPIDQRIEILEMIHKDLE